MVPHARIGRASERGITLVEILVVLVIIAIISSIGIFSISSSRASGQMVALRSSGHAYADAIDAFAREHRGLYPQMPGDWFADETKGPMDPALGANRGYLRRVPEAVQSGAVTFATNVDPATPTLIYTTENGRRGYRLELHAPGREACAIRGGATTSTSPKTCSGR